MTETPSKKARTMGNAKLSGSQVPGLAPSLRRSRLGEAIKHYNQAVQQARPAQPSDWFSARKNLSWAHKLAAEEAQTATSLSISLRAEQESWMFHICHSLGELKTIAGGTGQEEAAAAMGAVWLDELMQRADDLFLDVVDWIKEHSDGVQTTSALLRRVYKFLPTPRLCVSCLLEEAQATFGSCIQLREQGSYKRTLAVLPDCEEPLRRAMSAASKYGLADKLFGCESLMDSVRMELCIGQAQQAIAFGDQVLESAVNDEEVLSMPGVWEAVDFYHHAIQSAQERDVESEARAYSRLGALFNTVLKVNSQAKKNFKRCMELAATLQPRNLSGIDWFDVAAAAVLKYQEEAVRRDDEQKQRERQPFLEELKDELAALEVAAGKGSEALLAHVYEKHVPKDETQRLNKDATRKKQLLNAVRHYHPDKVGASTATAKTHEEKKLVVLYEEITKRLTKVYDTEFKSG